MNPQPLSEVHTLRVCEPSAPPPLEIADDLLAFYRRHVTTSPLYVADRECITAVALNTKSRATAFEIIGLGTLDKCTLHPRDVFRFAICANAASVCLIHNHPSGDPSPSSADHRMTRDLREAGKLLQIPLTDHLIVGVQTPSHPEYYSFREDGILF